MRKLTPALWNELQSVQKEVNARVRYRTDASLYHRSDFWTVAEGEGDCEDYSLAKRKALLEKGWPLASLRLAICTVPGGEGHAVLTVDTDLGTYVLDNCTKDVVPWKQLPYHWLYRQRPGTRQWEKL